MKHLRTETLADGYRFVYDLAGADKPENAPEMPCMNSYFIDEQSECPNSRDGDWSDEGNVPCLMRLERYFTDEGWFTDVRCTKFGQSACHLTLLSVQRRDEIALDQEWVPDAYEASAD